MLSAYPIVHTHPRTFFWGEPLGVFLIRKAMVALRARRLRKARQTRARFHAGCGSCGHLAGA